MKIRYVYSEETQKVIDKFEELLAIYKEDYKTLSSCKTMTRYHKAPGGTRIYADQELLLSHIQKEYVDFLAKAIPVSIYLEGEDFEII